MNFPESSLANLGSLGYTEDEARFLYLVATHSGYFSMRQFLQFTGTKSGDKSMAFSQKLLAKGHATGRSFLRNGFVYHLFSRIVYRAIDRENLRNRRAHSLEHNLQYEYLETEDDKLNHFCQQLDIPKELLPKKRYSGAVHNRTTERYFVDKFPMFLFPGAFSSPVATFTFVDPGLGILDSFKTHLLAYGSLFEALSEVRLVYISPRPTQFEIARKTFLATAGRPPKKDPGDDILRYFRLQKLWDDRKYGKLTTDDIEFLHLSDKRYARHRCQRLYPSWRDGIVSDDYVRSEIQDLSPQRKVIFESELVDGQIGLFEATPKRKPTPSTAVEVKNSQEGTFGGSFGSVFAVGVDKPMEK
ncbi:MAG: hypothetical protein DMG52_06975 [Acidobacteria bacterium]|nr:MAG: hypothetical protein DMG52_06975 [Acidobacteriota bacterium]